MGNEYRIGEKILRLYSALSDKDYIKLVKIGKKENINEFVKKLHMDSPASLLKIIPSLIKLFSKHPALFAKIGKTILEF
jgi:predicted house-cleaning noncanonical NTP pyrophosphatase (MazG superfamily)